MSERPSFRRKALNFAFILAIGAETLVACAPKRPMLRPDGSALSEEEAKALADPNIPDPEWVQNPDQVPQQAFSGAGATREGGGDQNPTDEEQKAIENGQLYGVVYAADGTSFSIVPDPANDNRLCAQISSYFQDVPGQRQDAGRLAQALGNGVIDYYLSDSLQPLTIDTNIDPFPSQVHVVHIGDIGCKNTAGATTNPSDY